MINSVWKNKITKKEIPQYTEKLTESGTWIVPKGVKKIKVYLVGGGGGGGTSNWGGGGGGGGGEVVETDVINVKFGDSFEFTIGKGGLTGAATGYYTSSPSTNGTDTVFSTFTARGGLCGNYATGNIGQYGGIGAPLYTAGGNGASKVNNVITQATDGVNGVVIDGEYYGSSAAGGGFGSYTQTESPSGMSGINAGKSYSWNDSINKSLGIAKANMGGGGGARYIEISGENIKTGADGIIIIYINP